MGFHYAKEKRLFDLEWNRLQKEYEDAGMEPSAIEEMRNYDWSEKQIVGLVLLALHDFR